jgi:hypothetical protein
MQSLSDYIRALFHLSSGIFKKSQKIFKKVAGVGRGWLSFGNTLIGHKPGQIDPVYRDNITTIA